MCLITSSSITSIHSLPYGFDSNWILFPNKRVHLDSHLSGRVAVRQWFPVHGFYCSDNLAQNSLPLASSLYPLLRYFNCVISIIFID